VRVVFIVAPGKVANPLNWLIVGVALSALPLFAGGRPAIVSPVTLYTAFQQAPPDAVMEAIQSELDTIMLPAGLNFDWHPLTDASGRVSSQLAVIHFKGHCDTEDLRPEWGYPGPLGWTHVSDGEILPFIDVNCEGVRLFVQRSLIGVSIDNRDAVYGRALARVLAHELYHFLANTKGHAAGGLAKAAYSAEELLGQTFRFGRREYDCLRSHRGNPVPQADAQGQ
jgi:hypothetical protein